MCGIAGLINAPGTEEHCRKWMQDMLKALASRGPDGQGIWLEPPVVLGTRRLTIIDRQGGAQPMADDFQRAVVVFNGEIYNFPELRQGLEKKGVRFKTRSDTEVLLWSYLNQGSDCLNSFEGMFAFAIWDRKRRTLFAARDRMGKKPFYYTHQNGVFAFASELSAFQGLPFLDLEVRRRQLMQFLAYEYVPTPATIYHQVSKLRPGHYLTVSEGVVKTVRYWDLPAPEPDTDLSHRECREKIRHLLEAAINRRLISDVPLGVFLSGGLDSSAIVALMAASNAGTPIRTFSVGVSAPTYDESDHARSIARTFATDHHEITLTDRAAADLLPTIVSRLDEPMSDPSLLPTYQLCAESRENITVALGGDGADELFAGYEYLLGFKYAELYLRLPRFLRHHLVEPLLRRLPFSTRYVSPRHVVDKFLAGLQVPPALRAQVWLETISPQAQQSLWLHPSVGELNNRTVYAETLDLFDRFSAPDPLDRTFYLFFRQYLLDYILVKVDRCSMMHGLEVRSPYLDTDLIEFVFPLPNRLKIPVPVRKYLLRQAVKSYLPQKILWRKKRGFLIPTSLWLKTTLRPLVEDLLGEDRLKRQGLFQPRYVRRLVEEHEAGTCDRRKELWTLLVLQLWLQAHNPRLVD
jgi:asparagine synthase (glutamine-hydrolysing)